MVRRRRPAHASRARRRRAPVGPLDALRADPVTGQVDVVRSPHLALAWSGEQLLLTDGVTGNVFAVTPPVLRTLGLAASPVAPERLAEAAQVSPAVVDRLVGA